MFLIRKLRRDCFFQIKEWKSPSGGKKKAGRNGKQSLKIQLYMAILYGKKYNLVLDSINSSFKLHYLLKLSCVLGFLNQSEYTVATSDIREK